MLSNIDTYINGIAFSNRHWQSLKRAVDLC